MWTNDQNFWREFLIHEKAVKSNVIFVLMKKYCSFMSHFRKIKKYKTCRRSNTFELLSKALYDTKNLYSYHPYPSLFYLTARIDSTLSLFILLSFYLMRSTSYICDLLSFPINIICDTLQVWLQHEPFLSFVSDKK